MKREFIFLLVFSLVSQPAFAALEINLERIIVTASRLPQDGQRVAGNVSVITKQQIEESQAQSVAELLQQVEGLFVYDFSTTRTATFDMRGFGDTASRNVLVLVDGRRLNDFESGSADLVQVPVDAIERIEIIRGASSVLYGDNSVGGVVNIVTKKGVSGFTAKLGATVDSYGSRGQSLQSAGGNEKVVYYISGKYLDKRGYRDNSDELYRDYSGRIDYTVNDNLSVGMQYGIHEDDYQLPGGLNVTELATLGRRGSANPGDKASTDDQYAKFTLNLTPFPEDNYVGHLEFDATWRDRKLFDILNAFNFVTDRDVTSKGFVGKYIYDRRILGRKVDFVTGIDYYSHENDILGSGSNSDDITISRDDFGVYTNLQFETIDDLYMIGGIRYYKANYTFNQRSGTPNFERQKPSETVSSAGLKYEYGDGSNLFFNWQQTFRFLTTNEWYSSFSGLDTSLKQQTGEQYEIGVKHNFDNKAIVSVTPYIIDTDNEIFFDPTNGFFGSNSNYDKIRRSGVEVGSRFDFKEFFENLAFFEEMEYYANYTYQKPELQEGNNDGKEVPFVPHHQASTGIVVKFLKNFHVSLLGRYVGSRFAINDTGNQLPKAKPYFVTDFHIAFKKKNYEIFMKINNLFDEKYETYHATNNALTVRDVYPAPEMNFLWGVNVEY